MFTRRVFAEALVDKKQPTVEAAIDRAVATHGVPDSFETDEGPEFGKPVEDLMAKLGVRFKRKDPKDTNAHATLDRAIATLKQSLFRVLTAKGGSNWAEHLAAVVRAQNNMPHEALGGATPQDVDGNTALQFGLKKIAVEGLAHNTKIVQERQAKLHQMGAFRPQLNLDHRRSFKPRFSDVVHQVAETRLGMVIDKKGQAYHAEFVLPVPAASEDIQSGARFRHSGSAQTEERLLATLEPYRKRIDKFLGAKTVTLNEASNFMKSLGMGTFIRTDAALNFARALRLLNFRVQVSPNGSSATVSRA